MSRRHTFFEKYKRDFRARQVARMRLPVWLAALMPVLSMSSIAVVTVASVMALWGLHHALHPDISSEVMPGVAKSLILFPSFFGAIAPGLMLLNVILRHIPPLRRIFDASGEGVRRASYPEAMKDLRKFAKVLVPPALALALLGAVDPWAF